MLSVLASVSADKKIRFIGFIGVGRYENKIIGRTLPTLVKSYAPLTLTLPDFHAGVKVLFLITNIKMVSKPSTSAFEGVKMLK